MQAISATYKSVIFVDSRVTNYRAFIDGLTEPAEVFVLDGESDGLEQIATALCGYSGIDAIHVISHGSLGALHLGSTLLNGCNVAQGDVGLRFIETLAQYTEANLTVLDAAFRSAEFDCKWQLARSAVEPSARIDVARAVGISSVIPVISWSTKFPSVVEGNSGTTAMTVTAKLSFASASTVSVLYSTLNGTAISQLNDYIADSGTLTFLPGETTKAINIIVKGDIFYEGDESIFIKLTSPSGAMLDTNGGDIAIGEITNDDASVVNHPPTGTVSVSGTPTQGSTLLASNTLADDDGLGAINYQWQAGGVNISGANVSSYKLTQAEVGKTITVIATYTDGLGVLESRSSVASAVVLSSDTTNPTVSTFVPVDEATGVAISSNITLTFSEPVVKGTGTVVLKTSAGAIVENFDASTSTRMSISGAILTVDPTSDLAFGTGYKLEFAANSFKDLAGNCYGGTTSYNFTTIADPANQTFTGTAANESFTGGTGNDTIDGGAGIDTSTYSGARSSYKLTLGTTTTVQDKRTAAPSDGTDSLKNIERLKFSDFNVALDLDGHAGQAAKLLGAVFGAASVTNKQFVGIALSLLDGGVSYEQLATAALGVTGKTTHSDVVSLLWTNLFGVAPSSDQVAPIVAILDGGMSQGALTVLVADTSFNTEKINLVGLSQTGIEFL